MSKKSSNMTYDIRHTDTPPLIVIVGETASGKSALAIELAEKFDGELICADAWTVRKGVDIGTAKPSKTDQERIPHHLLDVVEPCADFTAALFKDLALKSIHDISNRGKLPIMVGGTGLYVDGVLYDFGFLKEGDREKRKQLNELSVGELLEKVKKAGISTDGIDTNNKRRLIRLLETDGAVPSKKPLRENTLVLGVSADREDLKERIKKRVDAMLAAGLEQEVRSLAETYGWECEVLKGIGYREWQEYFNGTKSYQETVDKIIASTNGLAKRQRTWFRRSIYSSDAQFSVFSSGTPNKSIHWVKNREEAVDLATTFLNKK